MIAVEPVSFTPLGPKLQVDESYLVTNINNETFVGTVVCVTDSSLTVKTERNGEICGGIHVMPITFIKNSYRLSLLVPGERYRLVTGKETIDVTYKDIVRTTIRVYNVSTCKTPTCIYSIPLVHITNISTITC